MEIRESDVSIERQIVTGLIVSNEFITEIRPIIKLSLFQSRYTRTVADWCLSYYDQYEAAPNESIEGLFNSKKDSLDETTIDLIDEFLDSISSEYNRDKFNYKFYLDESERYLKSRNLKSLSSKIDGLTAEGNIEEAEAEVANFDVISRPESKGIDLFKDIDQIKKLLERTDKDELFRFKGSLGRIVDVSCRGELLAFFAPEKRGKSWWLQEAAMTALTSGCNVAFFSMEMSEEKMLTRFAQYLTGRPAKEKHVGCDIPYMYGNEVKYRKSTKTVLTPNITANKLKEMKLLTRGRTLKLMCWPSDCKTISDIKFQLDVWNRYEGFVPDVIVVDYADLLVAIDKRKEYRHQLDDIWKGLKRLAQEMHCLVVTASQTAKETQKKRIHKGSASEDKRKTSHPDRILALNQSLEDKQANLMKVAILFDRHDSEQSWNEVVVLQQLAIGRPYLGSYIQKVEDDTKKPVENGRIPKNKS